MVAVEVMAVVGLWRYTNTSTYTRTFFFNFIFLEKSQITREWGWAEGDVERISSRLPAEQKPINLCSVINVSVFYFIWK